MSGHGVQPFPDGCYPMKVSGTDPAEHCCQVASAVERLLSRNMIEIIGLIFFQDSDYCCCKEVRKNLILCLCTHQFVSHNPLCFVCAAVVRKYRVTGAMAVMPVTLFTIAAQSFLAADAVTSVDVAAIIRNKVTRQGGECLIGTAMETGMMNKSKAETAR